MNQHRNRTRPPSVILCLASLLLIGCGAQPESKPATVEVPDRPEATVAEAPEKKQPDPTVPKISDEAFRLAALEGRTDTVEKAIESGTDVNSTDPGQALTALHMAAYNGHSHTVKLLLEKGATIDCRDSEGKTPLIHACTGPFAETVEILLEAGADVNVKDSTESFTPLMMAAGLGQPEVVKVLLKHDADKTLVDDDDESASDHAENSGHSEIVKLLQ